MTMRRFVAPLRLAPTALLLLFATPSRLPAQAAPPPRASAPAAAPTDQAAIQAANEKDQQRLMHLAGIKQLRPPFSSDAKSPRATNYDESKANVYPHLPNPLLLQNGKPVTSAKMWWTQRRPQIVALFNKEIYGRPPAHLPKVTWQVVSTIHENNGPYPIVLKRLAGHVDNSADPRITVTLDLVLATPANAPGPVPVILQLGFPNQFKMALVHPIPESIPPSFGFYGIEWQRLLLARGWGYAVLDAYSFQADNGAGLTQGIIGLANHGRPRSLDDWGVLRAWAWGASRALDYFETDPAVDARQVGIEGHSRMGKASLVTMAYDPRFAIGFISSSGEGGAKLYRHIFGEQITNLAAPSEYHWMDGNFLKYAGPLNPGDLPVDNHELIALAAPRPVFIGSGSSIGDGYANRGGDAWADPTGMFLAEVAASPVYRLLGKKGLGTTTLPPVGTALITGDLGFRQHHDGHTPAPNWPAFIEFASRYLHAPAAPKPAAP